MKSSRVILSVRDLTKIFPNGVRALRGLSFDVYEGEFLVVIGLSGSGKSTLLKCLNRLMDPSSGVIVFNGTTDVTTLKGHAVRDLRRQIGMIFQHFNLVPRFTVIKNVLMGRLAYLSFFRSVCGLFNKREVSKAHEYLRLVGIADKAYLRVDSLSGGQQQRVAIARVLSQDPKIILADEPVASLDPATCHTVMEHLKFINKELGITIVCNLHFLSLVREYADRVIALKDGVIVYDGLPQAIDEKWFEKIYGEGARDVQVH